MRLNKAFNFNGIRLFLAASAVSVKGSLVAGRRQITPALLATAVAVAGCSTNPIDKLSSLNPFAEKEDESQRGTIGFVKGFLGGVAADEPRAVLIGRDILSSGGTAADAAVAVAFALSVTLPSSAGMGGGGVCVVHGSSANTIETLDFRPAMPKAAGVPGAPPVAVPGLVRGLALLHAKYGRLKWAQLVAPAENLARFGNRVSRAFGHDLKGATGTLAASPDLARLLRSATGPGSVGEGDILKQLDLSSVLGRLRARGAGDLYNGRLGRQLATALASRGGGVTLDDLRSYRPTWAATIRVPYIRKLNFHFPAVGSPSAIIGAQLTAMLMENNDWENASPAERAHLLAEFTGRVYAERHRWLMGDGTIAVAPARLIDEPNIERLVDGFDADRHRPIGPAGGPSMGNLEDGTGTGFVVADRDGNGVACGLSMNRMFGSGRVVPGMGIILAAPPGPFGSGFDSVLPMLVTNEINNVFYYAGAASGGTAAPAALINVLANGMTAVWRRSSIEDAMAAKRVFNDGSPGSTYYEQGMDAAVVARLARQGHRLTPVASIGQVNAILCPTGLPFTEQIICSVRSDPRGFGLASETK